jgi:hypothetical protein
MMLRAWAQPLLSKLSPPVRRKPRPRPARRPRPSARPGLEWLEARVVPNNARLLWVREALAPVGWSTI